ncbi:synovial sarcoma, X breakpoint 2 interacting protein a [Corythoichthys intestinalis]|uniref:synovial sarcoma, X breakpoint 2 interacting protein a n=1 Tax=Corythoichthys intestinalis TaxID=161448 RepID=UPI0025A637FC|nr:synovial sarcoma, X breakpoint 2 interacting protein a [Corythoichthys intestinalis]
MGEWWTTMPGDTSMGNHDISSISHLTMSPSRQNNLASAQPLFRNSCNLVTVFCTDDNVPQCISYINQELSSLGLSSYMEASSGGSAGLNVVPALNCAFELLQIHRRTMVTLEELEREQLKKSSTLDHMQMSNSRLRDQLELSLREKLGLHETERQLQLKIKTLQSCLKTEKEEVQKLQRIVASRASQYSHDAKRKEKESAKLKERLSQLLVDRKDKRLAIEMLNCLGRADGKRSHWKTTKVTSGHEEQMYKSVLRDYEASQRSLLEENAELKKVLQQMKKEMIHILSPRQAPCRGGDAENSQEMLDADGGEKTGDSSREILDLSCDQAREQLTNSIRQQWRKLRSHMEKLDHQVQNQVESDREVIPRETHEDEMEKMRREVQQCKEFIHTQQQLLQQQLNTSFDEETAELLTDCYTLEEKERLKEEWRLFEEQKRNFERERKYFTEAAIRLGREKKVFEDDRASWLKSQFLNMTPFTNRSRCSSTDGYSALSIRSEPERRTSSSKSQLSSNCTPFSTPKPARAQNDTVPSTAELYRTLRLIPDSSFSPSGFLNGGQRREACIIPDDVRDSQVKAKNRVYREDLSIFSLRDDENSLT